MHRESTVKSSNPFLVPFVLIAVFAAVEFYGAIWTQSLALLSDAWHMWSDVAALGLAMIAAYSAGIAKANGKTSRAELVASSLNALLMLVVIIWIVIEAIERLHTPRSVSGGYVMIIACIGLAVNLVVAKKLHHHEGEKGLNHQAALLHVIGDVLGSIAALLAGLVVYLTGWLPIDAVLSLFISLLLLFGTLNLINNIWLRGKGKEVHDQHHGHDH